MRPNSVQAEVVQVVCWEPLEGLAGQSGKPAKSGWKPRPVHEAQTLLMVFLIGILVTGGVFVFNNGSPQVAQDYQSIWYGGEWNSSTMKLTFHSYHGRCVSELAGRALVQDLVSLEVNGNQLLFTVHDPADDQGNVARPPRQYLFEQVSDDEERAFLYRLNPAYAYSFSYHGLSTGKQTVIPRIASGEHEMVAAFKKKQHDE